VKIEKSLQIPSKINQLGEKQMVQIPIETVCTAIWQVRFVMQRVSRFSRILEWPIV
jgi:hypothetical protein